MTPQEIETAARTLFEADQTGQQTGLLSIANPDMTMDDAYLVQAALIKTSPRHWTSGHRLEDRTDLQGHASGTEH